MTTVRASEIPLDAPDNNTHHYDPMKGKLTPLQTKAEVQASSETSKFFPQSL